jgi:hypothetical protein
MVRLSHPSVENDLLEIHGVLLSFQMVFLYLDTDPGCLISEVKPMNVGNLEFEALMGQLAFDWTHPEVLVLRQYTDTYRSEVLTDVIRIRTSIVVSDHFRLTARRTLSSHFHHVCRLRNDSFSSLSCPLESTMFHKHQLGRRERGK